MSNELATTQAAGLRRVDATPNVADLLRIAVEKNLDVASIGELVRMEREIRADRARIAFSQAFADFKRRCPMIHRSAQGVGGGGARYNYARLEDIQQAIDPILSACGLSYSFNPTTSADSAVTMMILRHSEGHSESFGPFSIPTATRAGMSDQQKVGSAESYARRYALVAALSLRVGDQDDDASGTIQGEFVTSAQANTLGVLCREVNADIERFLKWAGADTFDTISASKYEQARQLLEAKRNTK